MSSKRAIKIQKLWELCLLCILIVAAASYNLDQIFTGVPFSEWSSLKNIARQFDGKGNHMANRTLGRTHSIYQRFFQPMYKDGIAQPMDGPNPRLVSNILGKVTSAQIIGNSKNLSMLATIFGQFLDHDIARTQNQDSQEMDIQLPQNDARKGQFPIINSARSRSTIENGKREQLNKGTPFLDLQTIYGIDQTKSRSLYRSLIDGKLKVNENNVFPQDQNGEWIRADGRSGSSYILFAVHIMFHRFHNALCDLIKAADTQAALTDQQIFNIARNLNIAIYQHIIYDQFLPHLIGAGRIGVYPGYNQNLNPNSYNQINAAVFRYGHSMLTEQINKLDKFKRFDLIQNPTRKGKFRTQSQATFKMLYSASRKVTKQRGISVVDQVRDKTANGMLLDVLALDIQRCRDHGIPTYGIVRQELNLPPIHQDFVGFTSNQTKNSLLNDLYTHPNNLELILGIMGQAKYGDSVLGQVGTKLIADYFQSLRKTDRFWYQNLSIPSLIPKIKAIKLQDLLRKVASHANGNFVDGFIVK